jgi:redox-sensitive bicupin YhaK (pirin superfamily)
MHPHRDMEIITYVVSGALQHKDSMGNTAIMRGGDVQRISAGSGIQHSEINASNTEPVHLLQIWLFPDRKNVKPTYAEKSYAKAAAGHLHLVASKAGREGSITINQDTDLLLGKLEKNGTTSHQLGQGRHAWVQLIKGTLDVNGTPLQPGDAAAVSDENVLKLSAGEAAEFLVFDLN